MISPTAPGCKPQLARVVGHFEIHTEDQPHGTPRQEKSAATAETPKETREHCCRPGLGTFTGTEVSDPRVQHSAAHRSAAHKSTTGDRLGLEVLHDRRTVHEFH